MLKPICFPCSRFFKPDRNGMAFIEGMPREHNAEPGLAEPEKWVPYKLWQGDRWKCPGCGAKIIVGSGNQPVSEHYKPEFDELVDKFGAEFQVNDC